MSLSLGRLFPTSLVGSYPQPDWLIDRARLSKMVPRVRMNDLWRVDPKQLEARQDEAWKQGKEYVGVWHATEADARARQEALSCVPAGKYRAMVVSPLASGRLDPPDICLVYATPGQMIILINGLQWKNYRRFDWSVVGETACADSWGRALATGEPSLSLPCFAERRYGGVPMKKCSWPCRRAICPSPSKA